MQGCINSNCMDIRTTLSVNETFLEILLNCKEQKTKAAMLLDAEGIVRVEGFIKEIHLTPPNPYLELESGTKVVLKTIIAINGIFSPSYSEC